MKSPSEELVEALAPLLHADGLLLSEDVLTLTGKIALGTIRAEDWFLAAEKAIAKGNGQ